MNRGDIKELHYITPFANLRSILQHGILSYNRARRYDPQSVANPSVQAMRIGKSIPGGRNLHDYVNLYFSARNGMMFSILGFPQRPPPKHLSLCVIAVSADVLDLPRVVISDMNAAALLSKFSPYPDGLENLNKEIIFADSWQDPDPIVMKRKEQAMMAEALIPDVVPVKYLEHFYVCCAEAQRRASGEAFGVEFTVNRHLFFNQPGRYHD